MGYISRLQAINEMLLASGEDLVSDLDENSGIDTSIAEFILDRAAEEFLLRGTAANTYVRKLKPDPITCRIDLPNDIMSARLVSGHTSDDTTNGYDGYMVETGIRGEPNGYLFNVTEQTDKFDKNTEYTIEFIQYMKWEDMDTPIQKSIIASSSRMYQMLTQGDDSADAFLSLKEGLLGAKGKGADIKHKGRTIFQGDLARRSFRNRGFATNDPSRFRFWRHSHG